MGEARVGPCEDWATEADLCSPCDDYAFDGDVLATSLEAASDLLYALSGRQFSGLCEETIRPVSRRLRGDEVPRRQAILEGTPLGYGGVFSGGCSCRSDRWGCTSLRAVRLGVDPIVDVTKVTVDGIELDPSDYFVQDRRWLIRTDGGGFPCCQRLDLESTEDGTFEVEVTWGVAPPASGVRAAAALACEIAMSCFPEYADKCKVPKNATSLSRQGLQVDMQPLAVFLEGGATGIWEVDLFLKAFNPEGLQRRAVVASPDVGPYARRRT